MSHATVLVRVTAARLAKHPSLDAAIAEMMAPYEESPDEGEESPYVVFKDCEAEYRVQYETEKSRRVVLPNGKTAWPWDAEAKALLGEQDRAAYELHCTRLKVDPRTYVEESFEQIYGSFEKFMTDYASMERDADTGRFGYYCNPNKTWDWYSIGGRWTGFFPMKADAKLRLGSPGAFDNKPENGHSDVAHVRDIDMDAVATKTRAAAEKFYDEYAMLLADPTNKKLNDGFTGPRGYALDLGLAKVERGPAESVPGKTIAVSWEDVRPGTKARGDDRHAWTDVFTIIGRDEFLAKYEACFCPIAAYAALDDDGWHAPGKMGWFGASSESGDERANFARGFVEKFIKTAQDDDLLVVVDYHI